MTAGKGDRYRPVNKAKFDPLRLRRIEASKNYDEIYICKCKNPIKYPVVEKGKIVYRCYHCGKEIRNTVKKR